MYPHSARQLLAVIVGLAWAGTARAEPTFQKGPYLMDVQASSIAVMFEVSEPVAATVVARTGDGREVRAESGARAFHELVLEGLEPASSYDYEVILAAGGRAGGSFVTAPEPGNGPVELLVMGDNRTDATAHEAVVRAMLLAPGDFVLNTGDMVAHGNDPTHWQEMFDVQEPLLRSIPLFPTLGNHELYESGAGLDSFLLYTRVPREHGGAETYYAFDYGPARFFVVDSNEAWRGESEQRSWLETQLALASVHPDVDHIIVAMHHGPFSSGRHGPHEGMVVSGLVELLREHEVSLVLAGHDHAYERGERDGVKYIVTGGGGAPLYPINRRHPWQLAFEPAYHFLRLRVDDERVTVVAVRPDGSEIEQCGFDKGEPWECEGAAAHATAGGPVHPGAHPVAFWLGQKAQRPIFWVVLAVVLVAIGSLVALRVRARRRQSPAQPSAESQSPR
jgi:predicted phosphodiesterase